ncbi:putative uDP-N-acetylenolpyruvoylglucosamine reductase [Mycobacteroides abscessus]|nr:putative uDP-N-acetylenolpyruvoylglucosamine reductase [Mycobacteroides abscessus]
MRWYGPDELRFGYRTSILKGTSGACGAGGRVRSVHGWAERAPIRYPELAKELGVAQGDRTDASAVREAVLGLRRRKGMVLDESDRDTWSVGSFFTILLSPKAMWMAFRARVGMRHLGPRVVMRCIRPSMA